MSRRAAVAALSAAALAGSAATAVTASGHDGGSGDSHSSRGEHHGMRGEALFEAALAPTVPADPTLNGTVKAGGVPWVLTRGEVRLRNDGELDVEIRGLVIPALGTAGGVTSVTASLYCGGSPAATTPASPLSTQGNAEFEDMITVPAKCLGAQVLINPNGNGAAYIAATGFGG